MLPLSRNIVRGSLFWILIIEVQMTMEDFSRNKESKEYEYWTSFYINSISESVAQRKNKIKQKCDHLCIKRHITIERLTLAADCLMDKLILKVIKVPDNVIAVKQFYLNYKLVL